MRSTISHADVRRFPADRRTGRTTLRKILLAGVLVAGQLALPASSAQGAVSCDGRTATIIGTEGPDSIIGTDGNDVIVALGGNDRVFAGPGADVVCLGTGNDALNGGAGNDVSVAEPVVDGIDSFAGGSGNDTARYAARAIAVAVSLDDVPDDGSGDETDNIHGDVENIVGGMARNTLRGSAADNILVGAGDGDVMYGNAGDDDLRGGGGNDALVGGSGDDVMSGDAGDDLEVADADPDGADVFNGGSGRDTASYAGRTTAVRVFLDRLSNDGGGASGEGDNVGGLANDVEIIFGGSAADTVNAQTSFAGARLEGRAGNDSITSTNGTADTVDGGPGRDTCLADAIDAVANCP
jgi:Ca2+-binding RTX toxin-like protein